ncbi:hypothetical protein B0T26DRAFT_740197 [Lasiosphaeria miniovina]|uniref:Carboxylesterase family protein n=1 Tax=Lasiosphaeria miniovina TaxID=1954250 RepID=A0AA40E096_9PEZI|nr:uncharacterized protein B0T26DRAFT_740197 [Lasiosphaeria miniovina]KAK0723169.1 hypothetical protein B0T26DRAFT_740197 [Lasiosphaeria miniovina]
MATGTRPRPSVVGIDLDINIHDDDRSYNHPSAPTKDVSVLDELPLGNIQNLAQHSIDSLSADLDNFHIHTLDLAKENAYSQQQLLQPHTAKLRGRKARPHVNVDTFQVPVAAPDQDNTSSRAVSGSSSDVSSVGLLSSEDFQKNNALAIASHHLPSNQEQLSKHQAGQFEWVLSIPIGNAASDAVQPNHGESRDRRLLFGCNLVHRRTQSGGHVGKDAKSANIYTLLATRIEGDDDRPTIDQAAPIEDTDIMSTTTQIQDPDTTVIRMAEPHQTEEGELQRESQLTLDTKADDTVEHFIALSPADASPRIEDSVEAIDKLEEELEALNEVTRLDRVLSPDAGKASKVQPLFATTATAKAASLPKRTGSVAASNAAARRTGAETVRIKRVERTSSVRRSTSMTFSHEEERPASVSQNVGPRKSAVARPTSLLPPRPPARSSKPPTVSTFELPGEAVARRLKEQREARLSRQITSEEAAAMAAAFSPSKPHAKSTKPPTRPTFELPGEAISRRKREEREAKLRAQEEEERKRREFKARPVRNSIAPGSYPRETVASRARQGKVAQQSENGEPAAPATPIGGTIARKRQSMAPSGPGSSAAPRASLSVASGNQQQPTRGRGLMATAADSYHLSRATSATSTTGSIRGSGGGSVGKRSTISSEEAQQQKLRGKEILARDSVYVVDRERERREREAATKLARQEAAERSRQLSREWAKKQNAKKDALAAKAAGPAMAA